MNREVSILLAAIVYLLPCVSIVKAIDLNMEQAELAQEIFGNTMSPYCPGRLLQDCPSSSASELKENIRTRIGQGQSREDIEDYLISVYGDTVRASPAVSGFGLAAWLAPVAFLILGFVLIGRWLSSNQKKIAEGSAAKTSSVDPKWHSKIDKELE